MSRTRKAIIAAIAATLLALGIAGTAAAGTSVHADSSTSGPNMFFHD
jgi:hypothetical protein